MDNEEFRAELKALGLNQRTFSELSGWSKQQAKSLSMGRREVRPPIVAWLALYREVLKWRIKDAINRSGGRATSAQIAQSLNLPIESVEALADEMVRAGMLS